jgi:cell fate regulator YaaT (PSP1 superfamily)
MSCSSCSSGTNGQPKGCRNNGTCGTDGCNKLTVFDWLGNMALPDGEEPFGAVEIRFKNGRKLFFRNSDKLPIRIGDVVATEASPGHDVGVVTLTGELVRVQMKKKKEDTNNLEALPKIYRKASQRDIDIWQKARNREAEVQRESRKIAMALGLKMKISDVEFQGDGSKATFYYTADDRVDFRQLIKDMARAFHCRIEMKQVGFRQEAARLGGIGSCGRELCCSTWLTDFRSVNTSSARYQQLSLNPLKLAGQCGKLKCCLNYELDTYLEALEQFPKTDTRLKTKKGNAQCQKIDIFKGLMWYAYEKEGMNWHQLPIERVKEIVELNKAGKTVDTLEEFVEVSDKPKKAIFDDGVGQESITRFDSPKPSKRKRRNKNRSRNRKRGSRTHGKAKK